MLTFLFTVLLLVFIGKCFIFGLKLSWGILKFLCYIIFFPIILIGMAVGGLIFLALPILLIAGIALIVSGVLSRH